MRPITILLRLSEYEFKIEYERTEVAIKKRADELRDCGKKPVKLWNGRKTEKFVIEWYRTHRKRYGVIRS